MFRYLVPVPLFALLFTLAQSTFVPIDHTNEFWKFPSSECPESASTFKHHPTLRQDAIDALMETFSRMDYARDSPTFAIEVIDTKFIEFAYDVLISGFEGSMIFGKVSVILPTPSQLIVGCDTNHDGLLTRDELENADVCNCLENYRSASTVVKFCDKLQTIPHWCTLSRECTEYWWKVRPIIIA